MNKPIAIFLLLTGGMAQATPFLEVDLESSVASTASVKVYRKGKTKCGRFSGKTSHVTRESSANTDLDLNLSGEPSSTTVTGTSGASSATTGNWRKARENTAEAKIAVEKGSTSVALNLEDKRFFDDTPLVEPTDGRCTNTYSQWRFHSPTVSGKVRIGFVMPQDTWVVIVRRTKASQMFDLKNAEAKYPYSDAQGKGLINALNRNLDKGEVDEEKIILAYPGTRVYQEFSFQSYASEAVGQLDFQFEPITMTSKPTAETLTSLTKRLIAPGFGDLDTLSRSSETDQTTKTRELAQTIATLVYFVQKPTEWRELFRGDYTGSFVKLIAALERLQTSDNARLALELKIAAIMLRYEIARLYLTDFAPFCRNIAVQLPYQNVRLENVPLYIAARFVLSSIAKKMAAHDLDIYREFQTQIQKYITANRTFADVRADKTDYSKIVASYRAIVGTVNFRALPLTSAANQLVLFLTNSGQGIAEPAKVEELKGIAKTIAQNEEELAREWAQLVRSFQPNNSSPVDATKFNTRLVALQSAVIALKDYVLNQNNALNLSDSTEIQIPNNFGNETKTVLDLTVHSVEVFSRPMIGDLDYFRQAYFDQEELKSLVAISNQCLEVKP